MTKENEEYVLWKDVEQVIQEIQVEISCVPGPNIGKRGCVKRLQSLSRTVFFPNEESIL